MSDVVVARSWRSARGRSHGGHADVHLGDDEDQTVKSFASQQILEFHPPHSELVNRGRKSVLVVGAGPTGVLCAAFLRHAAKKRCEALSLSLWEDARGPSGRMSTFWTDVEGQRATVDVGAQVVSVRDPTHLPPWLTTHLHPASSLGLSSETSERGAPEQGWHHFYAPAGMTTLHKACLEEAEIDDLCFNRRVVRLSRTLIGGTGSRAQWNVAATGNYHTPEGRPGVEPRYFGDFDAVVFAGTAKDAGDVGGLPEALPQGCPEALKRVRYDHRYVLPLILKPAMRPWLAKLFGNHSEVSPARECPAIDLISWQEKKRDIILDGATAVVLHSTTEFAAICWAKVWKNERVKPAEGMMEQFADLMRMPLGLLRSSVIESKLVHWMQSQLRTPFKPPNVASAASPAKIPCLSGVSNMPPLILAGDYFLGPVGCFDDCLVSAAAAADSVAGLLWPCSTTMASETPGLNVEGTNNVCSGDGGSESGVLHTVQRRRWNRAAGG